MTTRSGPARLWLLGAGDPEQERIEALLRGVGEAVAYATAPGRDGQPARVHPGNAYRATGAKIHGVLPLNLATTPFEGRATVVLVECDMSTDHVWASGVEVVRVDHHRPGDPGYGRPPAEFLPASSIGQVIALLAAEGRLPDYDRAVGWDRAVRSSRWWPRLGALNHEGTPYGRRWGVAVDEGHDAVRTSHQSVVAWIPADLVLAAAADHCLTAAYQTCQCPGVDPEALAAWRDVSRATWQRRPVEAVRADRERAEAVLAEAPRLQLRLDHDPAGEVADLRAVGAVPELPEASARLGVTVLYRLQPSDPGGDRGGRVKVGLLGAGEGTPAGTAPVAAFLGGWAAAQGLVDTYGDPVRGFAGGYELAV